MKTAAQKSADIREQVENEVRETLGRLDEGLPRAVRPDFYAGVLRKIRARTPELRETQPAGFRRRVLVPALLVLTAVLNIIMGIFVLQSKKAQAEAEEKALMALAEAYSVGRVGYPSYLNR